MQKYDRLARYNSNSKTAKRWCLSSQENGLISYHSNVHVVDGKEKYISSLLPELTCRPLKLQSISGVACSQLRCFSECF